MKLSDISIRNNVFAWMLMGGLIIFGAIGFSRMGISQLPDVDFPILTISVTWTGASPDTMESAVADVLEDSIMSIEGIRNVTSTSQEGLTNIVIEFELSRDINAALQEVQGKLLQAQRNLPNDIDPPIVTKSNPEDYPIMWVAVSGTAEMRDIVLFIRDHLKDNLATVEGVGNIFLGGYVDPNMRIWLNTDRMIFKEVTVDDVVTAVTSQHVLTPSGFMDHGPRESNVRVMSEARTPEEFDNLAITSRHGEPVWIPLRLKEVAKVEEGLADIRRISRQDGRQAVGLGIIKQRGANAVAVGQKIKERIANLGNLVPEGMSVRVVTDTTKFIEESSSELVFTLTMAVVLTSVVCWLFLGSFSSAFNVILAIPTSLIGSFIVLYFSGFTLNTFTLLGLSLSIGIVVDDAIMVLENIVRHHESGADRIEASIIGAREITTAAIAASLSILAIFLPVVFMKGIMGKFFFQFGVTMSVAVMLSLVEALTLTPMRTSTILSTGKETRLGRGMDRFMGLLSEKYRTTLAWSLDNRWKVIAASLAVFTVSLFLIPGLRKEFVPPQDQSRFIATIQTPLGSSLDYTDEVFRRAEALLKARPEVKTYYCAIGGFQGGLVNQGVFFITMKNPPDRPAAKPFAHRPTQQEFMGYIRNEIKNIPGVFRATVLDLSLLGFTASRGYPVQFSIQGTDWAELADYSRRIMDKMEASGLVTDVDTDYKLGMPEIRIIPDRDKALARGVTVTNIANTISAAVGSLRAGKYTDESGHRDDIRIKLLDRYNREPRDIERIMVRNQHGEMVPLSQLVSLQDQKALLTITRYNRERAITIFANVAPGKSQADALSFAEKTAKEVLPKGYHLVLSGSSETFRESFASLVLALVLGIIVAYMVLGSQFNSFLHPAIVLLALPFSATGAFLAMRLTGISLNIYSLIGLLLLMGIVKKNSILLVDFTNRRRQAGLGITEALMEACPIRLRPILMTSTATIAAAIPAALALGPGAETIRPMAIVVIGGVIVSTMLTLLVVPSAYSLLSRFEKAGRRREVLDVLERIDKPQARSIRPEPTTGRHAPARRIQPRLRAR